MDKKELTNGSAPVALLDAAALAMVAAASAPPALDGFDPSRYLTKIDGRDYLEVKWRLLWLRTEYPAARISTRLVKFEDGFALFRAEATLPSGAAATGWGSETIHDFADYIEAAETKAIGRALAGLGFGTQFCRDFDFAAEARVELPRAQVVDAPVAAPGTTLTPVAERIGNGRPPLLMTPRPVADSGRPGGTVTDKQLKAIYAIARAARHLAEPEVDARCADVYGCAPSDLSKLEASQFIDALKGEQAA
ncbi:MAG: hypothetical protein M3Z04_08580 [Chloroflexota bacterium]|nr:hypothetical protein [Chloroflexota bacterium]